MSFEKSSYKKIGKEIAKEVLGNLPYAGFVIPVIELIENLVSPDQLNAAINWVQTTKQNEMSGEKVIDQKDLYNWLQTKFNQTSGDNSTYAFGYPYSFILDNQLIQYTSETSEEHLLGREGKYYGEFAPREKVETLKVLISDKWIMDQSEGPMPGDEQPILIPAAKSQITILRFNNSTLSSPIVNTFKRQTVTVENRNNRAERSEQISIKNWDEVNEILSTKIPSLASELLTK